jgi:DUF4097 and DUF4098 domain-containing protein YvlB
MKEERKRILEMVESGVLSAAEALTLLEELEKEQQSRQKKEQELMNELIVIEQNEKKEDREDRQFKQAKSKLIDFMNSVLKKIKDFDFDFQLGQSVDVSHVFHHADAYLTEMEYDIANGKIEIIPWDQQDVRLECQGKVYRTENYDEGRTTFLKNTIFSIENGKLRFSTQLKLMKVDTRVYVPPAEYERISVRIFNGPFSMKDVAVGKMKVKTANGKIELNKVAGDEFELETANGHILLHDCQAEKVEAETINGKIEFDGDFSNVDLHSFNGNMKGRLHGDDVKVVSMKGVTGNLELELNRSLKLDGELKTYLGKLGADIEGKEVLEEKDDVVHKQMRFVKKGHSVTPAYLFMETKTGSITVKEREMTK